MRIIFEKVLIMSEDSLEDFAVDSEDDYEPPNKKGRKKSRNVDQWKRNVRKRKRALGESYVSSRGKVVHKKMFRPVSKCCANDCGKKIVIKDQKLIFTKFWLIGDEAKQGTLLLSCLERVEKKGGCKTVVKTG